MDDIVNQSSVEHLFQLFAVATSLIIFWFLESVWRIEKRWLIPIIIFPCSAFLFIYIYWDESKAKCFFAAVLLVVMLLVGGLVGTSFFDQVFAFFKLIAFWPFYFSMVIIQAVFT